jgi:GNAT superfamily N-acetyltransferase
VAASRRPVTDAPLDQPFRIRQYPLQSGALEIQFIEEFFGEFDRKKSAAQIHERLKGREHGIFMVESNLPEEPTRFAPVSYRVVHEIQSEETDPELVDLVARLREAVRFSGQRVLYAWLGGTRSDWRGQGHFRALDEFQEEWAIEKGFREIVVKTKNRYYEMRGTLTHLHFDVVKYEPHPIDNGESKLYLSKRLGGGTRRPRRASLARYLEV